MITVSIVSHSHGTMVERLVRQLLLFPEVTSIVVTLNVPEEWGLDLDERITVVRNAVPKGFGANHNFIFHNYVFTEYFCVLNPDISLNDNPFPALLSCLCSMCAQIVAPAILAPNGQIEDSARYFPTIRGLAKKLLRISDGRYKFSLSTSPFFVDWVAGMFVLFPSSTFKQLNGFDEAYFLYYEDVDICFRARSLKLRVALCAEAVAVHDARRSSRRNIRHFCWHISSMFRFLISARVNRLSALLEWLIRKLLN